MLKQNISILNISLGSGGAEKVISLLLTELVKDYNVTLILLYNVVHFPIPEGVNVVVLSESSTQRHANVILKFVDFFKFLFRFIRVLKNQNIAISISFLALPNFLNSLASIYLKNIKTIISERGYPTDNTSSKLSYYISKILYPILYNRNSLVFSNSVYINKDLKDNFKVTIPSYVVYNPILVPEFKVKDDVLQSPKLSIANVGSINKRKNQELIINALNSLKNTNNTVLLSIYGQGNLENYLKELINKHNLQSTVHLKGNVKNVYEHLINHNCFVLSSNTEGFPNALLEAMAVGLPCISTNCLSGPLELLNQDPSPIKIETGDFYKAKYGLLINNNDTVAMAKAINFFLNNPEERVYYAKQARQRALDFELNKIYNDFKTMLLN